MKYFTGILLIIFIAGCEQEEVATKQSSLDGKIKRIYEKDSALNVIYQFDFYYDSINSNLNKMVRYRPYTNETDSVIISQTNSSVLKLGYYFQFGLPIEIYAYTNSKGYVHMISYECPAVMDSDRILYNFNYIDSELESFSEPIYSLMPVYSKIETKDYNIGISNKNYTSLFVKREFTYAIIEDTFSDIDTLTFTYTSHLNDDMIPLQRVHGNVTTWGIEGIIDPVYLLILAGKKCYNPNLNLIDKYYYNTNESQFSYVFNEKDQVERFSISNRRVIYDVDYY